MRIPRDNFLVQVERPYDDVVEINGMEIALDIKFDPYKFARQYGIVYSTPIALPNGLEFDVKEGDKIYFHHLVTGAKSGVTIDKKIEDESGQQHKSENLVDWVDDENVYKVHWQQIYARVRDGEVHMLNDYVLVEPVKETENEIKSESGLFLKANQEEKSNVGILKYVNSNTEALGAKVGDKIYFETNSDYEMDIEGERLFRMKNNDLIYVIKE